jgi:energy-coupling factor transport system permease protein
MSKFGSLYVESDSIFHKMNPAVKMLMFILWSITVFMYLDIRASLFLVVLGSLLLYLSKIPYRIIKNLFLAVIAFNIINAIFIFIISPELGITLAGHKTVVIDLFGYQIYAESVMYPIVLSMKYLSLLPAAIIFIFTTYPSQFACSLNRIGVPYKFAYTFNLIFRYLPEVYIEFKTMAKAHAARGITFGKDEPSFWRRAKNLFSIIIPLMNSALEHIDKITVAMELRNFGKKRVRTWYNGVTFTRADAISLLIMIAMFMLFIYLRCEVWKGFNYSLF